MACFLIPAGEAVVTTIIQKVIEGKEKENTNSNSTRHSTSWAHRLGWLNKMLWGGVILLALEHIWHGEIVPWPPFLTAMETPESTAAMLGEMATVGVAMSIFVTIVWAIIVVIAEYKGRTASEAKIASASGGN